MIYDMTQTVNADKDGGDTAEAKLNHMLSIVRKHLGMSVAFISEFIDGDRVFKLVDTDNENCPVKVGGSDPLEETYCKMIVDNRLDNIIPDASLNEITNKLKVTEQLSIGSYMGVPIVLSDGKVYGTFCCYKCYADQTLNQRDLSFLQAISEIAGNIIEHDIESESIYRDSLRRIQTALKENKLNIYYQPIYDIQTSKITGFESLSRFMTDPYRTPDVWFKEAARVGMGQSLELAAIVEAIQGLSIFGDDIYISINISPEYVLNGALAKVLDNVDMHRVVLEITEHDPVSNYAELRQALKPLRSRGTRIAVDDAGAGYSSFQHILELEADIIKLDISLTQNIHSQPRKYLLAKALCAFAKSIDCIIIAEGIETTEELNSLRGLGVDKVQGYLLGRPMPVQEALPHLQKS